MLRYGTANRRSRASPIGSNETNAAFSARASAAAHGAAAACEPAATDDAAKAAKIETLKLMRRNSTQNSRDASLPKRRAPTLAPQKPIDAMHLQGIARSAGFSFEPEGVGNGEKA
jgi:hypothetical protein